MSLTATSFSGQAVAFKTGAPRQARMALAVQAKFSRIGKQPITVPSSVTIKLDGQHVHVKVCSRHAAAGRPVWLRRWGARCRAQGRRVAQHARLCCPVAQRRHQGRRAVSFGAAQA